MTDLRTLENDSIRAFVQSAADEGYLSGRVLDYGCGKQPYRDIVEAAGGEYYGYDRAEFPANVSDEDFGFIGVSNWLWDFNTVLYTQVVQYIPLVQYGTDPEGSLQSTLRHFCLALMATSGHLILTYPTNWPEVEPEDLHRFTKAGMERLLTEAGFEIVRHERRGFVQFQGETFNLGYGVICRA